MRLVSPINLGAAKISTANIHAGEQLKPHFSKDFLGNFIKAPTAEGLMEHAGLSKEKGADPFIKHQASALANTLAPDNAAKRSYSVQDNLRLILAFWEVKKAPWWHFKVILEGLKSLLRTTKNAEVEQGKDDYISVPSPLELAKAELEKLSKKVNELYENHLHNPNQIDLKARQDDYRICLSAEKFIQGAYHACLAEIELSKKTEAAAFMEGFQATSNLAQQPPVLSSLSNEQLLITEEAEESVHSFIPDTPSTDNQTVNKISTHSTFTSKSSIEAQSFAKAWEKLKTFSRKGIELNSPDSGPVKKAHDFIHHNTTSKVVETSSAAANVVAPGSGFVLNSGAILVRSIAKGIMYSDASFREVEYKNAFRMQLRNNINFAIHEVEDMFSATGAADTAQAAAFAAAGMASGAVDRTLKENTVAMKNMSDKMNNFVTQEQLEQTVERVAVKIVEKLGRRNSIDSAVGGLSRTGSSANLNAQHQAPASPVIPENMQAGQALRAQSTSPEAQRPTTPELERLQKLEEENKALRQEVGELKADLKALGSGLGQVNAGQQQILALLLAQQPKTN